MFWFFGHPEVYIVALPFFGIVSEIIPVFSRKPIFGYKGLVAATFGIAMLSMSVWAHHMFATGQVLLPFFSLLSFLIAVPTGIKFFNWIGTMWRGQITFETPMLFAIGFLITFLLGGLSGVMLAAPPLDFHVSDSYFVVAHFHYVLFGTIVFAVYGGVYFWFPKMTGRMLDEKLGKVHFWLTFIGFHTTFLVQHWLGNEGMPRRYGDYLATDGCPGHGGTTTSAPTPGPPNSAANPPSNVSATPPSSAYAPASSTANPRSRSPRYGNAPPRCPFCDQPDRRPPPGRSTVMPIRHPCRSRPRSPRSTQTKRPYANRLTLPRRIQPRRVRGDER